MTRYPYILLVEDNPDDVDLTMRALRRSHLMNEVVVMKNGADALEFLFQERRYARRDPEPPQLVLLDINLPKVSGLEVLKRMREREATRLLPVVMLTTSNEEWDVLQSYRSGANSYVRKPVSFADFTEAVAQLGLYWLVLNEKPTKHQA